MCMNNNEEEDRRNNYDKMNLMATPMTKTTYDNGRTVNLFFWLLGGTNASILFILSLFIIIGTERQLGKEVRKV